MQRTKPGFLCRLGLHKWKGYGDYVLITWSEPQSGSTQAVSKSTAVYAKSKCLRCGVRKKRILADNPDGTKSSMGWAPLSEEEYNQDIKEELEKQK